MITRQQIKDAIPFKYNNTMYTVKATRESIGDEYYVSNFAGYVGNVLKIGTKSFTIYTFVMSKKVVVKVNYSECEPIMAD